MSIPTDTLFANQWHLRNTGQSGGTAGIDLDVVSVWDDYTGAGIRVAVIDDGFDFTHADLAPNYIIAADKDFTENDDNAAPTVVADNHGTAVMGLIGAARDGSGVVGVSYGATLHGYRTSFEASALDSANQLAAALNWTATHDDVVNMSFGYNSFFATGPDTADAPVIIAALLNAAQNGRGGLGTILVSAAGNERGADRAATRDTNADHFGNSRFTISVAAVNDTGDVSDYSSPSAAVLVSAFGSPAAGEIWTTDRTGSDGYSATDFASDFNGTSAASPEVAGVVALILDANEGLGWRDAQEILAFSARHEGSAIGAAPLGSEFYSWGFNGAHNWNGGGLHFSNDYGFGLVSAHDAVRLAETWRGVSTSANEAAAMGVYAGGTINIPDNDAAGVTFSITLGTSIDIESISLDLGIVHSFAGDLVITLTSPSGTASTLHDLMGDAAALNGWAYSSEAFRGEMSAGTWTVFVSDTGPMDIGTVSSATLTAYGSSATIDDTYIYTREFSDFAGVSGHLTTLADTDNGTDALNASTLFSDSIINLTSGSVSTIDGVALTITTGTVIENAYGGDGNDRLTGNALANDLYGGRGNDVLIGGAGKDRFFGGAGNDVYGINQADEIIIESANQGTDTVVSAATYRLGDNLENLNLTGAGATFGVGNTFANVIVGGAGNNTLNGRHGNDRLTGGAGADTFLFNSALNAVGNVDRIMDFSHADDTIGLDDAIFTALAGVQLNADSFFVLGSGLRDAEDRILYNAANGVLYYDADGYGAAKAVTFAVLAGAPADVAFDDFFVV